MGNSGIFLIPPRYEHSGFTCSWETIQANRVAGKLFEKLSIVRILLCIVNQHIKIKTVSKTVDIIHMYHY